MMFYAAGIVLIMIFMPGGIAGLVSSLSVSQWLRKWWHADSTTTLPVTATNSTGTVLALVRFLLLWPTVPDQNRTSRCSSSRDWPSTSAV